MESACYNYTNSQSNYLSHHGIKGQRWGIRRYQNYNGTLTAAGRRRVKKAMKLHDKILGATTGDEYKKAQKKFTKYSRKLYPGETKDLVEKIQKDNELRKIYEEKKSETGKKRIENALKYMESATKILGSAMTAYGAYATAKKTRVETENLKKTPDNKLEKELEYQKKMADIENTKASAEKARAEAYNKIASAGKKGSNSEKDKTASTGKGTSKNTINSYGYSELYNKVVSTNANKSVYSLEITDDLKKFVNQTGSASNKAMNTPIEEYKKLSVSQIRR